MLAHFANKADKSLRWERLRSNPAGTNLGIALPLGAIAATSSSRLPVNGISMYTVSVGCMRRNQALDLIRARCFHFNGIDEDATPSSASRTCRD
jgi:hypothetical protein